VSNPVSSCQTHDRIVDVPAIVRPTTAEVFRQNGGFAWRVLRRLGVRDEDVDDALQEVFVTVHRKLPAFEGRSSVRTWLYGICVRVALEYRRRWRARRESPPELAIELAIDPGQEEHVAVGQARVLLDRLLDQLDDAKRAVFVLYEIEELPMAEVAMAIECPLQTAYSRLHAARHEIEAGVDRIRQEGRSV
jgi:RNA polymerase sigma-70 factor (ECF subfamily)